MSHLSVRKIAVCGFGLIGGSIALDLARGRSSLSVVAYDRPAVLKRLKRDRRFSLSIETRFARAVDGADVVILAATHRGNEEMLKRLARIRTLTDCLIVDTGAVKSPIARLADKLNFTEGTQFLPTHPMAGRERAGFENSAAGLFVEHVWYLDDKSKLSKANRSRLDWMISRLKATPVFIGTDDHDLLVSEISHLPQLISTILGGQIDPKMIKLAGPGLRSMLRLAGSPYSVWSEIIDENRPDVVESLELFAANLQTVIKKIKNKQSLDRIFAEAARSYKCLS